MPRFIAPKWRNIKTPLPLAGEVGLSGPGEGLFRESGLPQASRSCPLPAATASDLPRCAGEITFDRARNRGNFRRAVTLLEVVFSMGVILIGLLGLLSILPLAGTPCPTVGQPQRGDGDWRTDGQRAGSTPLSGRWPAATRSLVSQVRGISRPAARSPDALPVGPFCLDPIFASSGVATHRLAEANANRYSASQFPYYDTDHNPLADPSTDPTVNPWPWTRPPMSRVGITRRE